MKKLRIHLCFVLFALLFPAAALADVPDTFREYVTWGNFNVAVTAFEKAALMMSDTGFHVLALASVLFAVLVWAGGGFISLLRSRDLNSWMYGIVIILIGATVYVFFIIPKSDLIVYDEPSNRSMVISEVPDGLILLAGLQNRVVRAAVDMIWTSSDPLSYRQNARGDIFNILSNVFENTSFVPSVDDSSGKNLSLSIQRYFKDCVLFELARPGSGINTNDFFANASILDVLAAADNPAVFTVYYDQQNRAGRSCSCSQAYGDINQALSVMAEDSGTNEKFWTERCEKAGYYDYDGADGDPAQRICRDKAVDFLALHLTPQSSLNLMKQHMVSNQIFNYIKLNHTQMLTDFKIMTAARGEASASIRWLPVLKGVMFAVYIALTPFVFLLIPTLVCNRAVQFIVGIFVFTASWEICDALLHSYAMDMAVAAFREIFNNGLSLKSLWMIEGESASAMVTFGKLRWASMILATTLSVVLAKFGGTVLAHLAGMINMAHHGRDAENEINEPTRRANRLNELPKAAPTEAITNEYAWPQLQGHDYFRQASRAAGAQLIADGHGGPGAAAHTAGRIEDFDFSDKEQRMGAVQDTAAAAHTSVDSALYLPHRSAAERSFGRAGVDGQDNFAMAGDTAAYGALSEKAAHMKNRVLDDIKLYGEVSETTQRDLETLKSVDEGRMAFLNSPAVSSNLNGTEKANLRAWLNDNGYPVGSLGSQASVNFALDGPGNIVPAGINSFEGHSGAGGFNFRQTQGESIDVPITPENPLMVNQNGENIEFVRGRVSGYQGSYFNIDNGVTRDGQLINGQIGGDGEFVRQSHPTPLEASSSSMLNLLSNNKLSESHMNIIDNKGAAIQSYVGAMRTYTQQNGIDSSAWDYSVKGFTEIYAGTPLPGIAGSQARGGVRGNGGYDVKWSDQQIDNMLSIEMEQKLSSVETNAQALEAIQNTFNGHMDNLRKGPDIWEGAKETIDDSEVEKAYDAMRRQIDKHGWGE